mmetsp:Transcript_73924/g.196997  ORF Transcript_73924/g.196997 Transcript_73924/m.196997 type:complete len:213 (-) Transcript_73924:1907-2545(-)
MAVDFTTAVPASISCSIFWSLSAISLTSGLVSSSGTSTVSASPSTTTQGVSRAFFSSASSFALLFAAVSCDASVSFAFSLSSLSLTASAAAFSAADKARSAFNASAAAPKCRWRCRANAGKMVFAVPSEIKASSNPSELFPFLSAPPMPRTSACSFGPPASARISEGGRAGCTGTPAACSTSCSKKVRSMLPLAGSAGSPGAASLTRSLLMP